MRDADGGRSVATFEARVPRFSIFYNESNTFWGPAVAQALRDVREDPDGTVQGDRVADDIAQFVDFENRAIPGALTGQTGSIGGGFVRSLDRGATWQPLTTRPAETEYLARTRPILDADPVLSEIRPKGDALLRYVIYRDGQGVDAGGTVDLDRETVVRSIPVAFGDLVATDRVFEARLDAVTTPITTTGFKEGAPLLDLIFPNLSGLGDSIIVEVEHVGGATVANRTTLDFDTDIVLTVLEASLGFYLDGLEALELDLDWSATLGLLWQRSFDLIDAELAPLYDHGYALGTGRFSETAEAEESAEAWSFTILGGAQSALIDTASDGDDLLDAAAFGRGVVIDGRGGEDTPSFNRLPEGASIRPSDEPSTTRLRFRSEDGSRVGGAFTPDAAFAYGHFTPSHVLRIKGVRGGERYPKQSFVSDGVIGVSPITGVVAAPSRMMERGPR